MADVAVGRPCPFDGTLVTYSGAYTDKNLVGICPYCKREMEVLNPEYKPAPPVVEVETAPPAAEEMAAHTDVPQEAVK
jgi:hypothetical protein